MMTKKSIGVRWLFAGAIYVATAIGCAQLWGVDKEFVLTGGGPNAGSGGNSGGGGGDAMTCGNGVLEAGEACDDGNNSPNDGCTNCLVDECFKCIAAPGQLSICIAAGSETPCQSTRVCNGSGACVDCVDGTQCNGGYCYQNVCVKCDDLQKNGDESDVDCGGAHCGKCADGKFCIVGNDCNSTFCVDGRCCADACDGACQACNIVGSEGTCDLVLQYGEDTNYIESGSAASCVAADGEACNGGGTCAKAVGHTCTTPAHCASLKCADNDLDGMKTCVKATGESCTANGECYTNMCDPGTMTCL